VYVKLFSSILTSSVWSENANTRLVWITLLALADKDGYVRASPSGLARLANVPADDCRAALQLFLSPDAESGTKDDDGRRIGEVEGGWHILNYGKYRSIQDVEARKAQWREYAAKRRADTKKSTKSKNSLQKSTEAEAEAEAETETYSGTATPQAVAFADPSHQSAYLAARRAAADPDALDASIQATMDGMHGTPYPPDIVGHALMEIAAAGSRFTPSTLRAFCRRLTDTAPAAARTKSQGPSTRFDRTRAAIAEFLATPEPESNNGQP
jgi:hypothetical protein